MLIGEIIALIGGLMLATIGYFLKQTMNELKDIKQVTYSNKTKIEVIENDYLNKTANLNEKFDSLTNAIKDLHVNIKELNNKIDKLK
jgi:predicted RNase H-like nuclease (RuvC/YqgF family)